MRNLDEAKRYCNEGMEIAQEGSYQFDIAKILCLLGEIKMIESVDATAELSQSVEIFSSLGRKYELATALVQLGQAHLKMGNREEGEKHLKASKEIFETLVCACKE
jgi:tetratricopeptide (TPR) repeat protein